MQSLLLLAALTLQDAPKIEWAESLDAALAQSAKDGRPVITYWTFDG